MPPSKVNQITAGIVFAIAFIVYWSTVAPTTSFWDCGEFIACSYTLGVPHPPGAPLYILIGRIFSMLPFLGEDVGLRVNLTSPLFSAFTSMFAYLIIVRLIMLWKGEPRTQYDKISIYGGGLIGALAFTFSDSQWFNSVESEVYAGSMFFTAIVVWLMLKWMDHADSPYSDRYVVLIFYLNGLAIGVHLLNLLALPVLAMLAYIHLSRTDTKFSLLETGKLAAMAGLGMVILGFIYRGIVKGIPNLLKAFDFAMVGAVCVGLVVIAAIAIQKRQRFVALAFMSIVMVVLGYSTYTTIYVRSGLNPAIDENNPDTPARLVSYLNREQYGDWEISKRRASLWEYQIEKMYIRYFNWQFVGKGETLDNQGRIIETYTPRGLFAIPFLIGLVGMFHHFSRDWRRGLSVLVLFVVTGLAIIFYLNQEDPQPRERDYAYTGSFFAFALWIGIGASALVDYAADSATGSKRRRSELGAAAVDESGSIVEPGTTGATMYAFAVAGALFLLVPGNMLRFNYHSHDRGGNYVAFDYSYNILESCAPNAILFTNGDNDTFPLWFLQYVHNIRPDVRVVNLSLLNTNWYIRQLKHFEPKVAINWPDATIETIQPQPWQRTTVTVPVPKEVFDRYFAEVVKIDTSFQYPEDINMKVDVRPTLFGQGLRVQDILILKILQDNQFQRPVYFAVTVSPDNKIGLDPYLRMDGLAFRVMPVKVDRRFVDPEVMWTNLNEKFRYLNLDNPDVYYDDNVISLLQNYRSAYFQLAQFYLSRKENDKALQVLDRMSEVMPEEVIPPNDPRIMEAIGYMYTQAGRPEEMDKRYKQMLQRDGGSLAASQKMEFANYFNFRGDTATAESLALSIIDHSPDFGEAYYWLGRFYNSHKRKENAVAILEQWLAKQPNDARAKADLTAIRASLPERLPAVSPADSSAGNGGE